MCNKIIHLLKASWSKSVATQRKAHVGTPIRYLPRYDISRRFHRAIFIISINATCNRNNFLSKYHGSHPQQANVRFMLEL